ncbi:hypothetical protein K505DRAFT_418052 [Melanomma pulvis-pyrius CBS 109.77]|uniref:EGF-like domain-containing protein n=1 Tax=Melanomma pulvis-pyrius CBS 109.77 TaxID=1314802 RepID=A0A6A6XBF5_9PLEO|nr:hypothetical protein K505DRAFT_418052 [Melanomma pulvis-pyrius CBS 109.77]
MKLLFSIIALLPLATSSSSQSHNPLEHRPQGEINAESTNPVQSLSHEASKRSSQIYPDYDSSGISPWNDNGRSETLDHITSWVNCPRRYLNCRKCPLDRRCRRPSVPKPTPKPTLPRPHIVPPVPGDPAALTGPQLAGWKNEDEDEGDKSGCELARCRGRLQGCGSGATCVRGYCACPSGLKGSSGSMGRGWDLPEAATVYVDAGVACDQSCEGPFCTEVGGLAGCFQDPVGQSNSMAGPQCHNAVDTTNTAGHGAIQIPGAGDGPDTFTGGAGGGAGEIV